MAWLDGNGPIRADVRTGRSSIPAGKSHSCDRPTSCGREPSAQTISVAEGRREAMRTARRYPIRFSCAVTARWAKMRFPSRPGNDLKTPRFALLALSYLAFISLCLPDTVIGVAWPSIRDRFAVSQAGLGCVLTACVARYVASRGFARPAVVALG